MSWTAIDLFAGLGGFTAAAESLGVRVKAAANHWPPSVYWHEQNHPHVEHLCQDLRQANFYAFPKVDLVIASPACPGHSAAGRPGRKKSARAAEKHETDRATAWAVVDCVEAVQPKAVVVENVRQLKDWPLYPQWRGSFEALGYTVSEHVLNAAHFGVPQDRVRMFVTALRKRRVVQINPRPLSMVPCSTILDDSAEGWVPVASKSDDIRERVAAGRERCGRRFLTQYVTGHKGRALDQPIATITTCAGHWHLVDGDLMRPLTIRELARAQSFPDTYKLPPEPTLGTRLVGNAVPKKLARAVIEATLEAA